MQLPMRTTVEDIDAVCNYLMAKPIGASLAEARAVLDKRYLISPKVNALKFWGLIEDDGNRIKVTALGRQAVRNSGATRSDALSEVIRQVAPYNTLMERIDQSGDITVSASEVGAYWHEHFSGEVSGQEGTLNAQVICFFHLAQAADLGILTIGRRGQRTRFDFDRESTRAFFRTPAIDLQETPPEDLPHVDEPNIGDTDESQVREEFESSRFEGDQTAIDSATNATESNRVFISWGENRRILEQVKEIVAFGKYEPVLIIEQEGADKPLYETVMDEMRTCKAAVIHVTLDETSSDISGNRFSKISENVLIEVGAAMALYRSKFILLVGEEVDLPLNARGLQVCRYKGDELDMSAVMDLLKAFNQFENTPA